MMAWVASWLRSATRVSRPALRGGHKRRDLTALARQSLVVLSVSMLTGCLVEDPPALPKAKRTAPRVDYQNALPLLEQLIRVKNGETVPFTIPVVSEDEGVGLTAVLLLDDTTLSAPEVLDFSNLPSSTLDDDDREFKLRWVVRIGLTGCHRVTLWASHTDNFDESKNIIDPEDLAVAYWVANINPELPNLLEDCPDASRPPSVPK